ncbi:unnamed protein product [Effrenium voratum]|nr:unnamed protein product [Effrenium voratum]
MAKGMQKYEALFMVTVFQGSNILSNSLSALVVLGEMDGEPWWQYCGYLGCIFGMMSGLILLVRGEQNQRVTSSMDLKAVPLDDESTVLSSSEEEPEFMDFIHAVARSPYNLPSALCRQESEDDGVRNEFGVPSPVNVSEC